MFIYNYHTHTYRCGHASGTDEEYVLAAIETGFKVLGFSDHGPYSEYFHQNCHMHWEQIDDYISSVKSLKEKYKDQIEIKLGFESEYYPFCMDDYEYLRSKSEYLLLGQHFGHPSGAIANYFRENTDEQIKGYCDAIVEGLHTGMYSYLCHPDVFMSGQPDFTEVCEETAHRIAQACVETGTPLEINARGPLKGKRQYLKGEFFSYPHKGFWKIVSEYPVKVVLGIDAHAPEDLKAENFVEDALNEVADLNLNFITEPFI